jgi:hypothetical protein
LGSPGTAATAGTANTGGGGGGGTIGPGGGVAQSGGSGIVIIAYPNSYSAATITGGVVQTIVGGNYIYTFGSSGTIRF